MSTVHSKKEKGSGQLWVILAIAGVCLAAFFIIPYLIPMDVIEHYITIYKTPDEPQVIGIVTVSIVEDILDADMLSKDMQNQSGKYALRAKFEDGTCLPSPCNKWTVLYVPPKITRNIPDYAGTYAATWSIRTRDFRNTNPDEHNNFYQLIGINYSSEKDWPLPYGLVAKGYDPADPNMPSQTFQFEKNAFADIWNSAACFILVRHPAYSDSGYTCESFRQRGWYPDSQIESIGPPASECIENCTGEFALVFSVNGKDLVRLNQGDPRVTEDMLDEFERKSGFTRSY